MAKRLKLKISRILQSCRSKASSCNPVPSFLRLAPTTKTYAPPPTKPCHSSLRRHLASALSCGYLSYVDDLPPQLEWGQEDEFWHVLVADDPRRKIYNSSASDRDDVVSARPLTTPTKKKATKRRAIKKKTTARGSMSTCTSSADSGALFSDDVVLGEETETLFSSSRSFSTDSEFSPRLKPIREASPRRRRRRRSKRFVEAAPARLSVFGRRRACKVEGKVRDSFAVVKRSEDPYEDFKRSMREMIVEKQLVEEKDLEQLLRCFLSLNSRDHHVLIVEAFAEIWESLSC